MNDLRSGYEIDVPTDTFMDENLIYKFSEAGEGKKSTSYIMFNNRWMPYAYAAFLGFSLGRFEPLEIKTTTRSRFNFGVIFNQNRHFAEALILCALSKHPDDGIKILLEPNKIIKTISEYSKGGLMEIMERELSLTNSEAFLSEILSRQ